MRKVRQRVWKIIVIVSATLLAVSLVMLMIAWMIPETEAGRITEKILVMRVLPVWITGQDFSFTGRHWTWVGIGWKALLAIVFIVPMILRRMRR